MNRRGQYRQNLCLICYNVVTLQYNKENNMAMTINSSPVLTGESARAFVEEAERNGQLPTPRLTAEQEAKLREIERKSREFYQHIFGKSNG